MAENVYAHCVKCRGRNFTPFPQCRECRKKAKKDAAAKPPVVQTEMFATDAALKLNAK